MGEPAARRSGVCVLRVEAEPDRLLVTITIRRYRNGDDLDVTHVRHFARPEEALEAVAGFLRSYRPVGQND